MKKFRVFLMLLSILVVTSGCFGTKAKTLSEHFNSSEEKIWCKVDKLDKDQEVEGFYISKKGKVKCYPFYGKNITLGEFAKMSKDELMELAQKKYEVEKQELFKYIPKPEYEVSVANFVNDRQIEQYFKGVLDESDIEKLKKDLKDKSIPIFKEAFKKGLANPDYNLTKEQIDKAVDSYDLDNVYDDFFNGAEKKSIDGALFKVIFNDEELKKIDLEDEINKDNIINKGVSLGNVQIEAYTDGSGNSIEKENLTISFKETAKSIKSESYPYLALTKRIFHMEKYEIKDKEIVLDGYFTFESKPDEFKIKAPITITNGKTNGFQIYEQYFNGYVLDKKKGYLIAKSEPEDIFEMDNIKSEDITIDPKNEK